MLEMSEVRAFSLLPQPVLTAYLDTNPSKTSNRGPTPEFLTWLNAAGKALLPAVPADERKLFQDRMDRIETYLRDRVWPQRGILIFAGSETWQPVALRVDVENELRWGRPALAQLLGLLSKHKPYGIAVVDLSGARFFRYRLGEMTDLEEKKYAIDISAWRKKDMGKVSRKVGQVSVQKSRGADRDTFERRMDEQYRRMCTETAERARQLTEAHDLAAFFLVGEDRLIEPIAESFPRELRSRVVKIEEDLAKVVSPALEQRLEPHIEEWERAQESETVTALLDGKRGIVIGIDETLAELQNGRIRVLLLGTDLDPTLRQCTGCGRADRVEGSICLYCGARCQGVSLREILPELAWKHGAEVEIIGEKASARLHEVGGMGGWLRLPKQAGSRRSARRAG
jgi:hypothetical protein